jgi:hypothetical protein
VLEAPIQISGRRDPITRELHVGSVWLTQSRPVQNGYHGPFVEIVTGPEAERLIATILAHIPSEILEQESRGTVTRYRLAANGTINKPTRIYGIVCFQHMRDALNAAIALNEAGFDTEILWEAIDDDSDAGFMKVTRNTDCDTDTALDAFHDQVEALVDPFDGWLDEHGFS